MKQSTLKIVGYIGQIVVVLVTLLLFLQVGNDFSKYDVMYSDGSDDARWRIDGSLGEYDIYNLIFWGLYLVVTALHVILYFEELLEEKHNWWTLPTFDMGRSNVFCIILSSVFSATFLYVICWIDFTMPEVFMPSITYSEMKELTCDYPGIDSFYAGNYRSYWFVFTLFTTVHIVVYLLKTLYNRRRIKSQ